MRNRSCLVMLQHPPLLCWTNKYVHPTRPVLFLKRQAMVMVANVASVATVATVDTAATLATVAMVATMDMVATMATQNNAMKR